MQRNEGAQRVHNVGIWFYAVTVIAQQPHGVAYFRLRDET